MRVSAVPGTSGFEASSADGATAAGDSVVIATGGGSLLAELGHAMVETAPVLGPIRTETEPIRGLSGVRVRCAATLSRLPLTAPAAAAIATERGELLFRDYGVSGIMVFDLSRYLQDGCVLSIDFFPDIARARARR